MLMPLLTSNVMHKMELNKIIIHLSLSAAAVIILIYAISFRKYEEVNWLIPLALFILFIADLIKNPGIFINSQQAKKPSTLKILVIIFITTLIIIGLYYRQEVYAVMVTPIFRISIGVFIAFSWVFVAASSIKKYKMHNKSVKQTD